MSSIKIDTILKWEALKATIDTTLTTHSCTKAAIKNHAEESLAVSILLPLISSSGSISWKSQLQRHFAPLHISVITYDRPQTRAQSNIQKKVRNLLIKYSLKWPYFYFTELLLSMSNLLLQILFSRTLQPYPIQCKRLTQNSSTAQQRNSSPVINIWKLFIHCTIFKCSSYHLQWFSLILKN